MDMDTSHGDRADPPSSAASERSVRAPGRTHSAQRTAESAGSPLRATVTREIDRTHMDMAWRNEHGGRDAVQTPDTNARGRQR